MENSNCIIITQKEWLNWLAFGYLRVSPFRISYFDNTESSFDKLMSHSVDNALDEEDAYLIASLVNDYSCKELYVKRTLFSDYISIQAVQGFYSLSIKGRDLLEYEMEQSHSILHCDSKIENLWSEWKNAQFRLRNHEKGNKFLEILGYSRVEVEPEIDDDTLFNKLLKNYNRRNLHSKLQNYHKRSYFAWLVINQEFKEKIGKDLYREYYEFRQSNQNLEIQDIAKTYKLLEDSFITNDSDSLFDYPLLIAEKSYFEKWHSDNSEPKEHYLASTILVHYYNILDNNHEINLLSLSKDLRLLDRYYSTNEFSRKLAYYIGRKLGEVYLSYLYIAKNIDEKKPSMFDTNFLSNKKKEKLTFCDIDKDQLQDIIRKVNVIAEEIKLAYNIEVNNVQASTLVSNAIEDTISGSNSPIQNPPPVIDSSISETNNNPTENLDNPSNTTNDDSTQSYSETQYSVDSQEPEANNIDSQTKVVNELNNNVDPSSNKQLDPYDKEDPIDSSVKIETITESVIGSKSDDNNNLEESEQLDSADYIKLAKSIYSKLKADDSEEKNTGQNFIRKFIEHANDSDKKKLRNKKHEDFFKCFGELIGDIETYQNINYDGFKLILDGKLEHVSGEQAELQLNES